MNYAGRPEGFVGCDVDVGRGSFCSLETAGMRGHKCPETEHLRQTGDTLKGQIDDRLWSFNPVKIDFRDATGSVSKEY